MRRTASSVQSIASGRVQKYDLRSHHRGDPFNCVTVMLCCNLHIRAYSAPFPTLSLPRGTDRGKHMETGKQ